ncbi:hypothetical protein IQ241_20185 [Romeria aff. gracilis LEGE 07310]|uniref:Uncharacterized protein n=1 Tax=Vasconcelosia minhoensis LEGE 07310 TaxID=915328 RepID=A0A8J7B000_9CYAN|nr:hypothetical protein [Romeria gracilis]MBE9079587.1 hypothetical protein [Romeria aff. gracilis LEGE 07310]
MTSRKAAKVSPLPRADLFIDGIDIIDYGMQLKIAEFSNFVVLKALPRLSQPTEATEPGSVL